MYYQALHAIPPDNDDTAVPIAHSNTRDKRNEYNLPDLRDMTLDKPPDPKHVI